MAEVSVVATALRDRADIVAVSLLGQPSSANRRELRWGRKGSRCLAISGEKRGLWYDNELGIGGDLLQLIAHERGVGFGEAMRIAEREFIGGAPMGPTVRGFRHRSHLPFWLDDAAQRRARALGQWNETVPLPGTLGERYFKEHRHLDIEGLGDLSHALRWHAHDSAVIALMADPVTGEAAGVHRTFLGDDGQKISRKMLGKQGVVRLSPDDGVTLGLGLVEGVEDGLAVLLSGWQPVWAATSAGAIARFPVLDGIEALTIFADDGKPGIEAARVCAARWIESGAEAYISPPTSRRR